MEKLSVIILRFISILAIVLGFAICIFMLPSFGATAMQDFSSLIRYLLVFGLYAAMGFFFFAIFHFWLLLNQIDKGQKFSNKHLNMIQFSGVMFGSLYFISAMPIVYFIADAGDAPGLILVSAALGLIPFGVASGVVVLKRILDQ